MSQLTSKIALYDGTSSFFSLDPNIINGVLCNALSDPTYLTFRVFFDFDSQTGLLASEIENYKERSVQNCALAYLKRIGDELRYQELKKFIDLLKAIQDSAFHCFESCSGLKDAWSRQMKDVLVKDKSLEFKLTESVDWRFATLWSLLRHVLFDYERMVHVLPVNLRTFNMTVYVTELRVFAETFDSTKPYNYADTNQKLFGISAKSFGNNTDKVFNNLTTENANKVEDRKPIDTQKDIKIQLQQGAYAMFGFSNCEFDMSSTGSEFFSDLSKTSDPTMASNNVKVKWSNCTIKERLPIVGTELSEFVVDNDSIDVQGSTNNQAQKHDQDIAETLKSNQYGFSGTKRAMPLDTAVAPDGSGSNSMSLKDKIKKVVKDAAKQVVDFAKDTFNSYIDSALLNAEALAKQQASRLAGKALGSAYGFNAAQLYALTNPQFALSKTLAGVKNAIKDNDPLNIQDVKSLFEKTQTVPGSIPAKPVYQTKSAADKRTVKRLGSAFSKDSM